MKETKKQVGKRIIEFTLIILVSIILALILVYNIHPDEVSAAIEVPPIAEGGSLTIYTYSDSDGSISHR